MEKALLKALAKERTERYPDMTSFLAALLDLPTRSHIYCHFGYSHSAENSVPLSAFTPNVNVKNRTREEWLDEGNRLYNIGEFQDSFRHSRTLFRSIQRLLMHTRAKPVHYVPLDVIRKH